MLHCRVHLDPCVRSIVPTTIQCHSRSGDLRCSRLRPISRSGVSPWLQRQYVGAAATRKREPDPAVVRAKEPSPRRRKPPGTALVRNEEGEFRKADMEQEVRYLKDPLKLADNTVRLLRENDYEKALEIVRTASKYVGCTVSWNHIIDYNLAKGKATYAIKCYNEMKKRGQKPDALTFTLIFRGLAWHPMFTQNVPRAVTIYHSMFAETSPVRPSIIHTNAVLQVCAKARDLDALLGVAARLPTHGQGAPNSWTFTIILNAIRNSNWREDSLKDEAEIEIAARRKRAILQGCKIWEEVVGRWRVGDIAIDEELVCAMGRLLLLGSLPQDFDAILSLCQQTMNIPRQSPRLDSNRILRSNSQQVHLASKEGEEEDHESAVPARTAPDKGPESTEEDGQDPGETIQPAIPYLNNSALLPERSGGEFNDVTPARSTALAFARPSRNTLSLLIDACTQLRDLAAGERYWQLLTSATGAANISPDSENIHMYLRLLRVKRASKAAVHVLQGMANTGALAMLPKTFRIAMSACIRDGNNRNVLEHADKLMELMKNELPKPDVKVLEMYAKLLVHRVQHGHSGEWREVRTRLTALEDMTGVLHHIRALLNDGIEGKDERRKRVKREVGEIEGEGEEPKGKATALSFMRALISVYDMIAAKSKPATDDVPPEEVATCQKNISKLTATMTRFANAKVADAVWYPSGKVKRERKMMGFPDSAGRRLQVKMKSYPNGSRRREMKMKEGGENTSRTNDSNRAFKRGTRYEHKNRKSNVSTS